MIAPTLPAAPAAKPAAKKAPRGQSASRPAADVQTQVRFGDLILAFSTTYRYCWMDQGSGAETDVAFYHPIAPEGFSPLGSIAITNYESPNGRYASLCVKDANPGGRTKPALALPLRYEWIYNSAGVDTDREDFGSCLRPIPPPGYVALGDIFYPFINPMPPISADWLMCVDEDLVTQAKIGDQIWLDIDSGGDMDFGCWQIQVPDDTHAAQDGLFAVNSFVGVASHTKPTSDPVAYCLRLPVPVLQAADSPPPTLSSRSSPGSTPAVVDRVVTVPFTAIIDNDRLLSWQVANSPFYRIERAVWYELEIFYDNQLQREETQKREITLGITRSESETFSKTTGVKVSFEAGVEVGWFSSKIGVELSQELGYSSTTSVAQFQSTTDTAELVVPAQTAAALWVQRNSLQVRRDDGTPVGGPLAFDAAGEAYYASQYPPAGTGTAVVRYRRHRGQSARPGRNGAQTPKPIRA